MHTLIMIVIAILFLPITACAFIGLPVLLVSYIQFAWMRNMVKPRSRPPSEGAALMASALQAAMAILLVLWLAFKDPPGDDPDAVNA